MAILLFSVGGTLSSDRISSSSNLTETISFDEEPMGVVVIDDQHSNDYAENDLVSIYDELKDQGYITYYSSEFDTWSAALEHAHYLLMTAPYSALSSSDITEVKTWMASGAKNLLLASRGDFSPPEYASMNTLLADLGSSITAQDDNVYTTDPEAYREWYIDTDNFNSDYSSLFSNVDSISFFSPSSVTVGATGDVLVTAEAPAYQTDQGGDPPETIYDDTNDGSGGESIPLAVLEEVSEGTHKDQIIVLGTTMWSDFDFGDSFADDPKMVLNMISYFRDKIIEYEGSVTIGIEDNDAPQVAITFPRNGAILTGNVPLTVDAFDAFGLDTVEIFINDELQASTSIYEWDTTTFPDGEYEVKIIAKDTAGNTAQAVATYVVYQDFEPVLNATSKVMTYNIKESGIFPAWIDVVKEENPDVLVLVETGDFDDNNNELLNTYTTLFNDYFIDQIPYKAYTLQDIDDSYDGITILSRFDITSSQVIDKVTPDNGSSISVPLPFLHAVIDVGTEDVHVIGAHLTAFPEGKTARKGQTEGILNFMDDLGDVPIIYLGDLNSESPEDTLDNGPDDLGTEAVEMIIDSSHPGASEVHTFVDVHTTLNSDAGNTYIVEPYISRIDYIFVNQHFDDLLIKSTTGDTATAASGSDHVPVDVVLGLQSFGLTPFTLPDFDTSGDGTTPNNPLSLPIVWIFSSILVTAIYLRSKKRFQIQNLRV